MTDQVPTEEQLDTLLALHTAASPGKWTAVTLPPNSPLFPKSAYWVETVHSDGTAEETRTVADCPWRAADAELIAATHTALPALVAEIRRLRSTSYSSRHVWQVWGETREEWDALYISEDDAKAGSIDLWEEEENPAQRYTWRCRRGSLLELEADGEPTGVLLDRCDVYGHGTTEADRLRAELAAVDEEITDFEEAATADPDTPPAALNMIRLLRTARTQAVV